VQPPSQEASNAAGHRPGAALGTIATVHLGGGGCAAEDELAQGRERELAGLGVLVTESGDAAPDEALAVARR